MRHTKLFELLFSISAKELDDFERFAGLSLNQLTQLDLNVLASLISIVNRSIPEETFSEVIKQDVIEKFYAGMESQKKQKQWNYTKNRLTNAFNRFIAMVQLERQDFVKNQLLLSYYHSEQLHKNFNGYVKSSQRTFSSKPFDFDWQYYFYKFQEVLLSQKEGQRKEMKELEQMGEALDNFYLENKLRLLVEEHNRERIINSSSRDHPILTRLESEPLSRYNDRIQIFYQIIQMMKQPEGLAHYHQAKQLFYANEGRLSDDYRRTICGYLMNQCVFYSHTEKWEFCREYIEYIKYLIDKKLLSPVNGLSITKYSNTIYFALVSGDLDWAEEIVEKYTTYIKHPNTKSIKDLNLANISLYRGEYDRARDLIIGFTLSETYFTIIYEKLCIKLYYETKVAKPLANKLAAFEKYLRRNTKLPAIRKKKNLNFVKAVRALSGSNQPKAIYEKKDFLALDYLWLEKWKKHS